MPISNRYPFETFFLIARGASTPKKKKESMYTSQQGVVTLQSFFLHFSFLVRVLGLHAHMLWSVSQATRVRMYTSVSHVELSSQCTGSNPALAQYVHF